MPQPRIEANVNLSPAAVATFLLVLLLGAAPARAAVPVFGYEIVHTYPHDPQAFTEGLFYLNGFLYESTGLEHQSSIRKVKLETGEVVQKIDVPPQYFGEGIVNWKRQLVALTWKTQIGFVHDLATLKVERTFSYKGEGWALTQDGKRLIMSDGTPELRFLDPGTLQETGRLKVTYEGEPIHNVNELEWVKGEIFANVWNTERIARIDPKSGKVVGWINLHGLLTPADYIENVTDVLNGIAFDAKGDRLFVTVTCWRKLANGVAASLSKGDPVVVTGRLFTRGYEVEGQKRSVTEVDAIAVGPDLSRCSAELLRVRRAASEDAPIASEEAESPSVPTPSTPAELEQERPALAAVGSASS